MGSKHKATAADFEARLSGNHSIASRAVINRRGDSVSVRSSHADVLSFAIKVAHEFPEMRGYVVDTGVSVLVRF